MADCASVERMCQAAHTRLNIPVTVLRLGQMYGHSETGAWNPQEM
jgi:thioester reductase-like protein